MQNHLVSRSFARASFGLIALAVASLALHPACSSNSAGSGDAGTDGGNASDGGATSDAGTTCTTDAQCGTKRYCEKSDGICRDAKACPQGQANCDYQGSSGDYCADGACYCDPSDSSCKPLHLPCTACTTSPQCGNDPNEFDTPADCVPPADGFAATQVCIPRRDGVSNGCPNGFTLPTDGGVYCTPAGGKCGAAGVCQSDTDCDPHGATPICDTSRNVCVAACTFDLKTGVSLCPTGQVCNLLPEFVSLPPSDPNFAKGRCGAPCTSATACGTGLVCRTEGLDMPVMRCGLPPPECLGDVECPNSPGTHSNGYCDLANKACQTDCRTTDDCTAGYLCTGSSGSMSCVAETCLQAGGAALGCDYGQFCCGEANTPGLPERRRPRRLLRCARGLVLDLQPELGLHRLERSQPQRRAEPLPASLEQQERLRLRLRPEHLRRVPEPLGVPTSHRRLRQGLRLRRSDRRQVQRRRRRQRLLHLRLDRRLPAGPSDVDLHLGHLRDHEYLQTELPIEAAVAILDVKEKATTTAEAQRTLRAR